MNLEHNILLDPIIEKMNPYGGIYRYWTELKQGLCDIGVQFNEVDLWKIDKRARLERFCNFNIGRDKPSIVHSSYYRRPLVREQSVKTVVTAYDCIYERYRSGVALRTHIWAKRKALLQADHIIAISNATKDDIIRFYDIDKDMISVCYLNVNRLFYHSSDQTKSKYSDKSVLTNEPFFLFVGARERYKNFKLAVEAVRQAGNAKLFISGGGELSSGEKNLLDRALPGRYKYLSFVTTEELKVLYKNAIALLYPSEFEGFGLPPLECMLSGGRVVAQNTSSLKEIMPINYLGATSFKNHDEYIEKVVILENKRNYEDWQISPSFRLFWENYSMASESLKVYQQL